MLVGGIRDSGKRSRGEMLAIKCCPKRFSRASFCGLKFAGVNAATGASAFFFDFGDPAEFIGLRLEMIIGVVVPGDGIETRARGLIEGKQLVGYADNRSGVQAAT